MEEECNEYIFILFLLVALMMTTFEASKFAREFWDARYVPFQPWLLVCVVENNFLIILALTIVWLGCLRAHEACTKFILSTSIYVPIIKECVNLVLQYSTLTSKI